MKKKINFYFKYFTKLKPNRVWFVIDGVGFDNFEMRCRDFDIHSNYDNFKDFLILRELNSMVHGFRIW